MTTTTSTFTFPSTPTRTIKSRKTTTTETWENGKLVSKTTTTEEEWEDVKIVPAQPTVPTPNDGWWWQQPTVTNDLLAGSSVRLDKDGLHLDNGSAAKVTEQSAGVEDQVQKVLKSLDHWINRPRSES